MRDDTCPDCRQLTAGDCGTHGPTYFTTSQRCDPAYLLLIEQQKQQIADLTRTLHERTQPRSAITAQDICARHLTRHPDMPNVPIQSVYEWLIEAQEAAEARALAAEQERDELRRFVFTPATGETLQRLRQCERELSALRSDLQTLETEMREWGTFWVSAKRQAQKWADRLRAIREGA
jgi:hypothetical protein